MARSKMFILPVLIFISTLTASGQDSNGNSVEIYALASNSGVAGESGAAGFCVGGAWRVTPRLSLVGDVSRHFVSDEQVGFTTLLAGPRVYSPHFDLPLPIPGVRRRLRAPAFAYVQFLVGSQRSTQEGQPANWNLFAGPGAGVDVKLSDHWIFRPLEIDLALTQQVVFARISSGFAFRFGH